jgi:hypothetical protein
MKKTFLFLFLNLVLFANAFAQQVNDKELQKLMSTVGSMRHANQTTWKADSTLLSRDSLWTALDEAERHQNEYWLLGNDYFKLNKIHNELSGHDKKMLLGEMLNGNDTRYNYSMTERGIKAGRTVSYELTHRVGRQTFVVMPYRKGCTDLEVKMFRNGHDIGHPTRDADGNIIVNITENIQDEDMLRLDITNQGTKNMPVVIINHNTRRK